jgi:hypothetical protein
MTAMAGEKASISKGKAEAKESTNGLVTFKSVDLGT